MNSEKDYCLNEQHLNMRIDAALSCVSDLSRSALTKLIKGGHASINGQPIKDADFKITRPLTVRLLIPANPQVRMKASLVDFKVVYEDKDLLIIDKPAGVVVHPGIGNHEDTLANGLMHQYGDELSSVGGVLRPGIVHRLDKDTSGLMIVAKNNIAHSIISEQISKREVNRYYLALVWGMPIPACGKIENFLKKSPTCHTKMVVCPRRLMNLANSAQNTLAKEQPQKPLLKRIFTLKKQGKYALTYYECLSLSTNKPCKMQTFNGSNPPNQSTSISHWPFNCWRSNLW
jgi:23S rRNA pseudouridine1911/1915/1917 synthase